MKKYIQPSIKVKEMELASMIASSNDDEKPVNNGYGGGTTLNNEHRGWNLWGVED